MAIQQFAETTRSSSIDFFASKDEIFIYDTLDNSDLILVCIFENKIQQSVAREIIHQIKEQMKYIEIHTLPYGDTLDRRKQINLDKNIEAIAKSLISIDYQVMVAQEIFSEISDLIFLLVYDYQRNKIHFYESLIGTLSEEEKQFTALKSIQRNMMKMIKGLHLGSNFRFIVINGSNYVLSIAKYRTVFNVGYSQNPNTADEILEIPFQIMSLPAYSDYSKNFVYLDLKSRWKLDKNYKLSLDKGQTPYWNANELITKLLQSHMKLLDTLGEESFDEMLIYVDEPGYSYMRVRKKHTLEEYTIDIFA
ncbi:MAG: hypothetical protein ACXAB7_16995 [Candidatus Kariarchaeaceae archaeon]|jgi:hypothetical protein